jgi:hypothetical protein
MVLPFAPPVLEDTLQAGGAINQLGVTEVYSFGAV